MSGAILTEGTIGQSIGGKAEGCFLSGPAGYDAAQDKDVLRKFEKIPFPKINPYTAECAYFADCVLQGKAPKINGPKNALHILDLTEKAYASYKKKSMMRA